MVLFARLARPLLGASSASSALLQHTACVRRPTQAAAAVLVTAPTWQLSAASGVRAFASAPQSSKWGVINDDITARVVQLVGDDGKVSPNVPLHQAVSEARRRGVDLVQVSASGDRVVCRMFDAKKRLFSMKKAAKPQKPKQDKEVVFGSKIENHDIKVKVEQVKKFLAKGHKVKVTVKFAQQYHLKAKSLETIAAIQERITEDVGVPDPAPREQFGGVYIYFAPSANASGNK